MVRRIDGLTPTQQERMASWANEWIEVGLCTDEADWTRAEAALQRCYELAGLPWHGNVVRVSSPIVGALAVRAVATSLPSDSTVLPPNNVANLLYEAIGLSMDEILRRRVDGAIQSAVYTTILSVVAGAVDTPIGGVVHDAVHGRDRDGDSVMGDAVLDAVERAVGCAIGEAAEGAVNRAMDNPALDWPLFFAGSLLSCSWAYYSFYLDVCELEWPPHLMDGARAIRDLARSAGWWWPWDQFVMICDRPSEIHREQVGPPGKHSHWPHNDRGPSIAWRDGWSLWHIHGVEVTEQIVMHPETITIDQVMQEKNAEMRRIMCEQMGWETFVERSGAALVDACADPCNEPYQLTLHDLPVQPFSEPVRLLLCTNASPEPDGSRRRFGLTVPSDISSALDAAAWTFGVAGKQYAAMVGAS